MFIDAFFGASCDFVDVNGCFGNDDVFRAARDCRIKSDVAAVSAHDFKHHDTTVRSRRVAKFHNRVDDGVASGVEADRVVGVSKVVVDRAGDTDAVHVGVTFDIAHTAERAVAADDDKVVYSPVGKVFDAFLRTSGSLNSSERPVRSIVPPF